MGPIAVSFGLSSAAVFVIAALFSTRDNRNVAGFLALIWIVTNIWDFPTGSDHQLYLDMTLGCLCGLLCMAVMHRDRRAIWPLLILGVMASWIVLSALYAEVRDTGPQAKFADQLASNVLYGLALLIAAVPGGRNGACVVRHWLSANIGLRAGLSQGHRRAGRKAEGRRLKIR